MSKSKDLLNALKNPFNDTFLKLNTTNGRYRIEQTIDLCEELEKRYKFAPGTRVQMTVDYPTEDEGRGWEYCSGHYLKTWNVGTVTEISHIRDGEIRVFVQWDFQPTRDGKKNEKSIFPWSEKKLKIATAKEAKPPKSFVCPDVHKDAQYKKEQVSNLKEAIKIAEKNLKDFLKKDKK
jgi:hypothetical protein